MKQISLCEPVIGDREQVWMKRCLDSGFVSSVGRLIGDFEERFAEQVGARYAVAVSSGTAALHVALRVAGVEGGDWVAVPDLTFVASVNPVLYQGANPFLVDVDADNWCLDLDLLEEALEGGQPLKAVVPVHLYGCSVDMGRLMTLAARYGFAVIEDATEALGTLRNGTQVGLFGDLGCFSFNGNKLITTGAGGMVVTNDAARAKQVRYLVNQAKEPVMGYQHGALGFNYRMPNLNAALGLAQLEQLDFFIQVKRSLALRYQAGLTSLPGVELHPEASAERNCFWLYSICWEQEEACDQALATLLEAGIRARRFFEPLHAQRYLKTASSCCRGGWVSDGLAARGMNLPSSVGLAEADQDRIIALLREIAG